MENWITFFTGTWSLRLYLRTTALNQDSKQGLTKILVCIGHTDKDTCRYDVTISFYEDIDASNKQALVRNEHEI